MQNRKFSKIWISNILKNKKGALIGAPFLILTKSIFKIFKTKWLGHFPSPIPAFRSNLFVFEKKTKRISTSIGGTTPHFWAISKLLGYIKLLKITHKLFNKLLQRIIQINAPSIISLHISSR